MENAIKGKVKRQVLGLEPKTLLEGKPYVPATRTDVLATFKRFGWTPPSEKMK